MHRKLKPDVILGLLAILFGVVAILWWVPADTGSGFVVKSRGKFSIGDAFAPTIGFLLLITSGLLLIIESWSKKQEASIERSHIAFGLIAFLTFLCSLLAMRWVGPLAVALFAESGQGYRELRDTLPWKYLGYLAGGSLLVGTFISLSTRKMRLRHFLIGLGVAAAMILVYDLPFEDLLLPPNGDV
ncbi:hypothetical protein NBRC116601_18250 [Cognatishimia sp. WU-CL00825]|uniref:hypothetical protein n=1 Tax=Cognatishimia sp. WU-CL00825 TaxID=3127658 RepID=UPI003108386A